MILSRRQFIRTFTTVLGIALVILLFQIAGLLAAGFITSHSWPKYVTRDYMAAIKEKIIETEAITPEMIMDIAGDAVDGQVSGLILHAPDYSKVVFFGTTPKGDLKGNDISGVSQLRSYAGLNPDNLNSGYKNIYIATYDIYESEDAINLVYYDELMYENREIRVPQGMNPNDVSGRIIISYNNSESVIIEVLVSTLGFYGPTRFFLDHMVTSIISVILVAIVVAMVSSFLYSRRNTRKIDAIKNTVSALSHGKFDVEFKKTGVYELDEISDSLSSLAHTLETNRKNRQEWVRSIGHDLNTPITSMNLLLDGARDGIFKVDEKLVDSISGECKILSSRIDSIRYYSFISDPDLVLERSEIGLFDLVDDALSSLKVRSGVIKLDIEEGCVLNVDQKLVARAIKEVVANALHEAPDGPIVISSHGGVITIKNPGKLPSSVPQFFEPWSRGDLSRHEGGSGMGLPITGKIMELHGGTASISETDGAVVVVLDFKIDNI